jgi:transposase InsO family protein
MTILALIEEAVEAGARRATAASEAGLDPRTLERWRAGAIDDKRSGPRTLPTNKLSARERERVVRIATSPEYRDLSPKQIVPRLADKGSYVASESTFYRVLRDEKLLAHRGRAVASVPRHRPEHCAVAPRQVWSWDITYLRTQIRGQFFYLYLMLDVWSRKVVGWRVEAEECADLASNLLENALKAENHDGKNLVVHADNGGPMKGATMKATMEKLGVVSSFSRPRVSDDNAFSEALFRTAKYWVEYPRKPFASLEEARVWVAKFVGWYNNEHLHSGIGFVTPADRHARRDAAIRLRRRAIYERARRRHPERWANATRAWDAPAIVRLNPDPETEFHATAA